MTTNEIMLKWRMEEYLEIPQLIRKVKKFQLEQMNSVEELIIPFGNHKLQKAIYITPKDGEVKQPLIYYIHGGAWRRGSAETAKYAGYYFARLGYRVLLASYRLAPEFKFPCQLEDLETGLAEGIRTAEIFEKSRIIQSEYSCDFSKVIFAGQSAGGHLAGLLAFGGKYDSELIGLINFSGPLDIEKCVNNFITPRIKQFIGNMDWIDQINPLRLIAQQTHFPDILCFHGKSDGVIEIESSSHFIEKYNEVAPDKGELFVVEGGHHTDLASYLLENHPIVIRMEEWLNEISIN